MSIYEARRANLKRLAWKAGGQKQAADIVDVTPGFIGQLCRGERNMGEKVARKIEKAFGIAEGAMDLDPDERARVDRDSDVLREIVQLTLTATRETNAQPSDDELAGMVARLFSIYQKTGQYPDPAQLILYEALGGSAE